MSPESIVSSLTQQIRQAFSLDLLIAHFSISVEKHIVKKNRRPIMVNRRTNKRFVGKSHELKWAETELEYEIRSQANKMGLKSPFNEPLWVIYHFYFEEKDFFTKKGEISKTLPDLSNLLELPSDCLQRSGIIANDTLIHSLDLSRRLVGPTTKLEIFILKYNNKDICKPKNSKT